MPIIDLLYAYINKKNMYTIKPLQSPDQLDKILKGCSKCESINDLKMEN